MENHKEIIDPFQTSKDEFIPRKKPQEESKHLQKHVNEGFELIKRLKNMMNDWYKWIDDCRVHCNKPNPSPIVDLANKDGQRFVDIGSNFTALIKSHENNLATLIKSYELKK